VRRRRPNRRGGYIAIGLLCLLLLGSIALTRKQTPKQLPPLKFANLTEPVVELAIPLDATAAVLMDSDTGQVLFSKDAHRQVPPASLTKMLTALVAVQGRDLDLPVRITAAATRARGARVGLSAGSEIQLGSLIWGMLMLSGNDAACAIAIGTAGSMDAFCELMNLRAEELGAKESHFVNPNGLPHPEHISTAYDQALVARALLKETSLAEIVQTQRVTVPWGAGQREFRNINRLLRDYPGALGLKTGYTDEAGFCLAAAAKRNGKTLISIVLGCSSSQARYNDSIRLLDQGFANYTYLTTGKGEAHYPSHYHTVKAGQTLSTIAQKYNLTDGVLAEANSLRPPYRLEVGQILLIP
jgi:D-alanyl-D-alanine carboxypeptidase (penicillin-binding protein 5/6)